MNFFKKFHKLNLKDKDDKKKIISFLVTIIGILIIVTGTSVAYLASRNEGAQNTITAGALILSLPTEGTSITLNDALPQEDVLGLTNDSYTFSLENTGDLEANYEISLQNNCVVGTAVTINSSSVTPDVCIPNNYVKVGIKKSSEDDYIIKSLSSTGFLYKGTISQEETINFDLKIWLDYNIPNDYQGITTTGTSRNVVYFGNIQLAVQQIFSSDKSGANEPELVQGMIPVYYDETDDLWKKANSNYVYYRLGDITGDGVINVKDLLYVQQFIANNLLPTSSQKLAADVNGDGNITEEDQTLILSASAGSITTFPAGDPLELRLEYVSNTNENNWYNYGNKKWANAVTVNENASSCTTCIDNATKQSRMDYYLADVGTPISMDDINTMWVWIPRYSYTIKSEDGTNYYGNGGTSTTAPGSIDVKFVNTSTTETGTAQYTGATATNYYTHPSFWWDSDDDGIRDTNEEKAGIWFAKFETSHTTLVSSTEVNNLGCADITCSNGNGLIIKPDVQSLGYNNISNFFLGAKSMQATHYNTYGFANDSTYDVHMIKNDEWGAVAYLSQSIYGRCTSATSCSEVYINNSSGYYTGRSGGNVSGSTPINGTYEGQASTETFNNYGFYTYDGYLLEYNTNTKSSTRDISKVASTTGNIYGIYDMSGGSYDYVMGNYNDEIGGSGISITNNKYYNKYANPPFSGDRDTNISFCTKATCGGHALNETARWYSDDVLFVSSLGPWFIRGGLSSLTSDAGMFYMLVGSGNALRGYCSRYAIVK